MEKPLIFITNDDGVNAKGLHDLIEATKASFRLIVVAPEEGQSGMSHAITMTQPLYLRCVTQEPDLEIYACSGTPVDCVKIAFDSLMLDRELPALILSGINHGSNSAINVLYSGTMGAAIEASFYEIPSIGLSLLDHDPDADFTAACAYVPRIIEQVLNHTQQAGEQAVGIPFCVNVNVPNVPLEQIQGVMTCRQNHGYWREEFECRKDPRGRDYYWLTGYFHNMEQEATDTDEWALRNNYISLVPIQVDLTNYKQLKRMKDWTF